MADFNIANVEFSKEESDILDAHVKGIQGLIRAKLTYLNNKQRQSVPKMGDNREILATEVDGYLVTHPQFKPGFQKSDVLPRLLALDKKFGALETAFKELKSDTDSTRLLIRGQAASEAGMYYEGVQSAYERDIQGSKEVYDVLSRHFSHYGRKKGAKNATDNKGTDGQGTPPANGNGG